jgi:hypothetical protein
MYKVAFGIAVVFSVLLAMVRWLFPAIPYLIVLSPFAILASIVVIGWILEALFELFKILMNLGVVILIIYLISKLF